MSRVIEANLGIKNESHIVTLTIGMRMNAMCMMRMCYCPQLKSQNLIERSSNGETQ